MSFSPISQVSVRSRKPMELKATGNTPRAGLRSRARSRFSKREQIPRDLTCCTVHSLGSGTHCLRVVIILLCVCVSHMHIYQYGMPLKYI